MKLAGRTAIVTGAVSGIGRAIATRLAEDGANVVIFDLANQDKAAADIEKAGGKAIGFKGDISSEADVDAAVAATLAAFGGIDIIVNNAAMFTTPIPFEEIKVADWRRLMDINVLGPYLLCRAVSPHIRKSKAGRIINIVSNTSLRGTPYMLNYVTSKGALQGMTRALSREFGKDNVTVNAIAPGFTLSDRIAAQTDRVDDFRKHGAPQQAIQRDSFPADLAGAAAFLASDDSAFVSGQTIVVDGGMANV